MKDDFRLSLSSLVLLARLWLHEPDSDTIGRASSELGLPAADPAELASAYADLFLLNVYPYSTVFTDPSGELNGANAQRVAAWYGTHDYQPDELHSVGAPDHLGLCLGFLSHLSERESDGDHAEFRSSLLSWAPICCLAVEREPNAHLFYRALAEQTRNRLLSETLSASSPLPTSNLQFPTSDLQLSQSEDDVRLHDVVSFLLAPARCGVFLSRSRLGQLAREIGLRLSFGSRYEVAEMLFGAAGQSELIDRLFVALQTEIAAWATAYRQWAEMYSPWRPIAELWLARITQAGRLLAEMRQIAKAALT